MVGSGADRPGSIKARRARIQTVEGRRATGDLGAIEPARCNVIKGAKLLSAGRQAREVRQSGSSKTSAMNT